MALDEARARVAADAALVAEQPAEVVEAALTESERDDLARHEETIRRGQQTFIEVGMALADIRARRLYRETHGSLEAWLGDHYPEIGRRRAYQLIDGAAVAAVVNHGALPTPASERSVRPLAGLEPEQQRDAYAAAVEAAGGRAPTGAQVERAAAAYRPEPEPATREPWQMTQDELIAAHPAPAPAQALLGILEWAGLEYRGTYRAWPGHAAEGQPQHVVHGRLTRQGGTATEHTWGDGALRKTAARVLSDLLDDLEGSATVEVDLADLARRAARLMALDPAAERAIADRLLGVGLRVAGPRAAAIGCAIERHETHPEALRLTTPDGPEIYVGGELGALMRRLGHLAKGQAPAPAPATTTTTTTGDYPLAVVEDDEGEPLVSIAAEGVEPIIAEAIAQVAQALRLMARGEAHQVDTPLLDDLERACAAASTPARGTLIRVLEIVAGDADKAAAGRAA